MVVVVVVGFFVVVVVTIIVNFCEYELYQRVYQIHFQVIINEVIRLVTIASCINFHS
jgi:hypothetical protein